MELNLNQNYNKIIIIIYMYYKSYLILDREVGYFLIEYRQSAPVWL